MPKETFHRLPEEKKKRILEAAQQEFTSYVFSEASINRIIKAAGIPRGSFYQYFEDKQDLFVYFLNVHKDYVEEILRKKLVECEGEVFSCVEYFLERLLEIAYKEDRMGIRMLFAEPWIFDMIMRQEAAVQEPMECYSEEASNCLLKEIDMSLYLVKDREELVHMVMILLMIMRDCINVIFVKGSVITEEIATREFYALLDTLKRHYLKLADV